MDPVEHIARGGRLNADALEPFGYLAGFGNTHATEALHGALPIGRNAPQRPAFGLYAEQLSGTPFTAPRASNRRSWLYRIRPSVKHATGFQPIDPGFWRTAPCRDESTLPPMQLRWGPLSAPEAPTNFITGVRTMTTCGDAGVQAGMAAHVFFANRSMDSEYFYNCDGELLILPEQGALLAYTEMGALRVSPGEILVIPRGIKFAIRVVDGPVRGFFCENYGAPLSLPERGPIGANGLAAERDFLYPLAAYEEKEQACTLFMKWCGKLYKTALQHSPLDVVAWHGNYAPYKYDLRRFNTIGSISFDHPDPSIFTVLTSPSDTAGSANVDFVIFPDRWLVMEDTFRPPWYHVNCMSEFMGLLYGVYDAKPGGFKPGGMSLHNAMLPHGPDAAAFDKASAAELQPQKLSGTMAFMFETRFVQSPTAFASEPSRIDLDYAACWEGLERKFSPQ